MKKTTTNTNSMHNSKSTTTRSSSSASTTVINKLKTTKTDQDVNAIFRRTEVIGRGKFGIVYKGYNIKTKQIYAIKVLNLDSDSDEVEDVQREIQFLASLKQMPNITRYYGSYLQNTSLWIIMEYCAGGSLRSLLRPGKIDEKYIGVIMRELLIALSFIHKDNIIHRDIKAANVLISNDGSIKLCDFGVAAQLNQASNRRQTMAGTPYWMAPEVIMDGVYYDTKADIWSLGITAYEIATGNPPYCEIEALRVMQLITKSKPPRLEGKSYSPALKEFIALCLDEDANERPTADDLLKSKFIKVHRTTPTSILKELITRYLLFRDKTKRDSLNPNVDGSDNKLDNRVEGDRKSIVSGVGDDSEEDIDMKWDFDSLSSADYIVENNINIDNITNDTNYWTNEQHDNLNDTYPDEDQYMYYQTNNNVNKTYYHGTTMGKAVPSTLYHNSTLNAMPSYQSGTNNMNNTAFHGTGTHTTSNNTTTGTHNNRSVDTSAPKQLLELFEESDTINEVDEDTNHDLGRIPQNISTTHMGSLVENTITPISDTNVRPVNALNQGSFFSQSTTSLPVLQTKFSSISQGPTSAMTSIPTSVEIEIPEELPTSTSQASNTYLDSSAHPTKPRSSTLSTSPMPFKQPPGLSRRLTVSGNNNMTRSDESSGVTSPSYPNMTSQPTSTTIEDEIKKSSHSANSNSTTHSKTSMNNNNSMNGTMNDSREHVGSNTPAPFKNIYNTPSPLKILHSGSISPNRKPNVSPSSSSQGVPHSSLGNPPTMKPLTTKADNKNIMLHPLNTAMSASGSTLNSATTAVPNSAINAIADDNELHPATKNEPNATTTNSRSGTSSKRNNFNLKLQMPLPTTMTRNKLLENNTAGSNTNGPKSASIGTNNGVASAPSENINQFGFNTKTTAQIPVSMTPISEKHIDFGSKIKRSLSVSNRKNSLSSNDSSNNVGGHNVIDSNSTEIHAANGESTPNNTTVHHSSKKSDHSANGINHLNGDMSIRKEKSDLTTDENTTPTTDATTNVTSHGHMSGFSTNRDGSNRSVNINPDMMKEPPTSLDMSMFLDTPFTFTTAAHNEENDRRRIDKRPQVLQELENLLCMFEDNLPVLETTLKKILQNPNDITAESNNHIRNNSDNNNNNTNTITETNNISNSVTNAHDNITNPILNNGSPPTIMSNMTTGLAASINTPSPVILDENTGIPTTAH
ncbi:hypothetical protein C6P45_001390 [Maudiozyma exigua]|uniref:non-specific serine/threonine protein kinase n=1 Tax=Maudiozyma exigua TaxID=34358 RepID=A0A9P6W0N9_MAUEX|nr:hypothetical protein C6P45_001390 [Kazachstania exigua]